AVAQPLVCSDGRGVGRLVTLSLRLGAEPSNPGAGGMDADLGGVEHRNPEDIAIARWPGADDLREERDADAHELARLAAAEGGLLGLLFFAKLSIADRLHRLGQGGVIVAGI